MSKNSIEPLVSIITPCYNGERFLKDYFESILAQDYSNLEIFFVNDGSNDNTENIAIEYKKKFENRNIRYVHMKQENQGQAAAINLVLPLINGKYFMWPDSDDILLPNNVSEKVKFLEQHPDFGLVIGQAAQIDEMGMLLGVIMKRIHNNIKDNMFEDLIDEKNVVFCPGIYMVSTEYFKKAVPAMRIYAGKGGQNWQMLLPIIYKYRYGYLDSVVYYYRIVENSHSRNLKSYDERLKRIEQHKNILLNTVGKIDMSDVEQKEYRDRIWAQYFRKRMKVYGDMKDYQQMKKALKEIKKYHLLRVDDLKVFVIKRFPRFFNGVKTVLVKFHIKK